MGGGGGGHAPFPFWRPPDHLSPASPRPLQEGRGRKGRGKTYLAGRALGACAGPDRSAASSLPGISPLPLLAVTLYIRVTCPPGSEELSPLPPGSSRLRHRGRCGGAPGPAAAAAPLRTRGSP